MALQSKKKITLVLCPALPNYNDLADSIAAGVRAGMKCVSVVTQCRSATLPRMHQRCFVIIVSSLRHLEFFLYQYQRQPMLRLGDDGGMGPTVDIGLLGRLLTRSSGLMGGGTEP
jgi:hypothetical protein